MFTPKVDRAGRMFLPGVAPGTLTTCRPVTRGVAVMRRSSTGVGAPLDSRGRLTLPPGLRASIPTDRRVVVIDAGAEALLVDPALLAEHAWRTWR